MFKSSAATGGYCHKHDDGAKRSLHCRSLKLSPRYRYVDEYRNRIGVHAEVAQTVASYDKLLYGNLFGVIDELTRRCFGLVC